MSDKLEISNYGQSVPIGDQAEADRFLERSREVRREQVDKMGRKAAQLMVMATKISAIDTYLKAFTDQGEAVLLAAKRSTTHVLGKVPWDIPDLEAVRIIEELGLEPATKPMFKGNSRRFLNVVKRRKPTILPYFVEDEIRGRMRTATVPQIIVFVKDI